MNANEIIKYLREHEFTIEADGDYLEISPPEKITEELVQRLRKHKPALIAELKCEQRRLKVLANLAEKPETKRAIITDLESDLENAILTIVIRDQCTFEIIIPREKYDAFLILELINKVQIH